MFANNFWTKLVYASAAAATVDIIYKCAVVAPQSYILIWQIMCITIIH